MELELIKRISDLVRGTATLSRSLQVKKSLGDDCAEVIPSPGKNILVTTDTMCENVHFRLSYFSARQLGVKLASVNLSDMAAMGGLPRWAVLNIEIPPGLRDASNPFWTDFFRGLIGQLQLFGAVLTGGDTVASSSEYLGITLTLLGEVEPGGAVYRSGAEPGDLVYCSGQTGEAACGLEILENPRLRARLPGPVRKRLEKRHLEPCPRLELGRVLAASGISSLIDTSDGIASDLAHIAEESRVRAVVFQKFLPLTRSLKVFCRASCNNRHGGWLDCATRHALFGGEDFELLWTVSPGNRNRVERAAAMVMGHRPFLIGRMEEGNGCFLDTGAGRIDISFRGYEH